VLEQDEQTDTHSPKRELAIFRMTSEPTKLVDRKFIEFDVDVCARLEPRLTERCHALLARLHVVHQALQAVVALGLLQFLNFDSRVHDSANGAH
jgi:hypothetical protein